jgi:uncharacterized protein (DUF305 family)
VTPSPAPELEPIMPSADKLVPTVARVGALAAVSLVLTACGSDSPTTAQASPRASASLSSTEATPLAGSALDRTFINGMVAHHRAALDMAEAELASGRDPQVKALAQTIVDAQTKEIATLSQIASKTYGFTPAPAPMMPMGEMMGVPMTTDMTKMADMVRGASDPDKMFLRMMIPHHASAISMADEERNKGADSQLKTLADSIIADQGEEIGKMQAMLASA